MKIAVITCYDQNDYVRARVLRTAFAAAPGVEVLVIRNEKKGLGRYLEVPLKILKAKFKEKPDAYVIVFRGYEMLPFVLMIKGRKPLIFDEFINAAEYLREHQTLRAGTLLDRIFRSWYGWLLRRCRLILTDTDAHADYSAEICRVDRSRYRVIPVSTDETVFSPPKNPSTAAKKPFNVFYYGHAKSLMTLHGLQYVLQAAELLKKDANITFTILGGKEGGRKACQEAIDNGARLIHHDWIPFEDLPALVHAAGITLGGPFGKTLQSQFVITGKTYQFLAAQAPVLIARNKVTGLFKDKQNCLMVPPADPKSIVEAIRWASVHPKELTAIAKAGRELYQTTFSQKVINQSIKKLVAEL